MEKKNSTCARCSFKREDKLCRNEKGEALSFCPTKDKQDILHNSLNKYKDIKTHEFARQATLQAYNGVSHCKRNGENVLKPMKTRIEEIIEFAKRMNYRRIGLAFCGGLMDEAKVVDKLLSDNEFNVMSVICKVGRVPTEEIGIEDNQKICPGSLELICNPIMQAQILNDENTDFNILLGLCVGHDSLFFKHSNAMCTVFAVKDRLLGHNPLAAIYNINSSYNFLKK